MEEAEVNSENQEIATPEAEDQTPKEQTQKPVEDSQEKNWRVVRQRIAQLEKEGRDKDDLLKKALEFQKAVQPQEIEVEEPDDDYIPKGKVKKLAKKEVEPLLKEIDELKSHLAKQRQRELITSLKSRYSDFDDIVNPETIALFETKEPELAETIAEMQDPYKMAIQTYKYIKASNISDELPEKRRQKEAEKKLEKNAKTVQSPLAYDKRPMAQAFRMTESEKTKLWEEMNHYGSLASSVPPLS
jgi:hypothetical protein